jgi:glycosyltransferase involved in cell wall biosynthesis
MRVAYSPISVDFSHPEDRRRVHFYLNEKKLKFEYASLEGNYDLIFLSTLADIEGWRAYKLKNNCKVIFNLTDSYLSPSRYSFKNLLRGPFRFLNGQSSRFRFSYQNSLKDLLRTVDAVTCGSPEAKLVLSQFNSNVHVINDYFMDDIKATKKSDVISGAGVNILWQGLSHGNLQIFKMLREILVSLDDIKVNLHLISNQNYCSFGSMYSCQPTSALIEEVFKGTNIECFFYSWHSATFSAISASCDLALIPIPSNDLMMWGKPENKLIELWSIGLPVLTSPTPAYRRVMTKAGLEGTCDGISDWRNKITKIISSSVERNRHAILAKKLIVSDYSKEKIISQWDDLLLSLAVDPITISKE